MIDDDSLKWPPSEGRRVPKEFTEGYDRHNAEKAWLHGYDRAIERAEAAERERDEAKRQRNDHDRHRKDSDAALRDAQDEIERLKKHIAHLIHDEE